MSVIDIKNFGGEVPSASARSKPGNAAQTAKNLLPSSPEFRPLANSLPLATSESVINPGSAVPNPKTLYRNSFNPDGTPNDDLTAGWMVNADEINLVRGPIHDIANERVYYTGTSGNPQKFAWQDGTLVNRPMGVPAPPLAPTVALVPRYTFTLDTKVAEKTQAVQQAIEMTLSVGAVAVLVGLEDSLPANGWLRQSEFSTAPEATKHVMRLFAVNPATNALINTYSAMPVTEAGWVFDPALSGAYVTAPPGYALPSWATGHSKWWAITLPGFAEAFDIDAPALSAALQSIDMPGTQGAAKWFTAAEADDLAARLAARFDKDYPTVKSQVDSLRAKQAAAVNHFSSGGAASMTQAVAAFYASAGIAASIESAKSAFAEEVWRCAEAIGTAVNPAVPYVEVGGSG